MRPPRLCSHKSLISIFFSIIFLCLPNVYAYFIVNTPSSSSVWRLGDPNPVRWTKSVDDGIHLMDMELARLNSDGLTYIAKYVPTIPNQLNIVVQDIPTGDDYFLILINSTHGVMYATSQRFSIVDSATDGPQETPVAGVPTVTVSGAPDPTRHFATTLAIPNGVSSLSTLGSGWLLAGISATLGVLLGGSCLIL